MDEYSSRRAAGGLVISRRAPSLVMRDSGENNRERNAQVCSRVGCSSKLNSLKPAQVGPQSKAKTLRTPLRSPGHGKDLNGSSSRTLVAVNSSRKSYSGAKKKSPSRVETDSETNSVQEEAEVASESISTSGKTKMMVHPEPESHEHDEAKLAEIGSSSSGPTNRVMKRSSQRFGLGRQDSPAGSSASFAFRQVNRGAKNGPSTSRCNLRNLKCNSMSDFVPPGSSSTTESSLGRKRDIGRKRIGESESSFSTRGKKISGPVLDDRRNDSSNCGISICDSRRNRNPSLSGDNDTASMRTRRPTARTRLSNQENLNRLPLVESPFLTPSSPLPDISLDPTAFSLQNQLPAQNHPSNRADSFSRPGSSTDHTRPNRSVGPYEVGITRPFVNRDTLRQYNLDGIAEMLLALERIEQEEEPTYEQLLVLETNLFLGGLAFHDQHRDLRLDIDNMSYEELLALEERMGTVSTALSEVDLVKCLTRSIYQGMADCRGSEDGDDIKCSVCQEEYANGDEVGILGCDHRYHVECIHQWLGLKNWCPICKASAAPSPSPSASAP